MDQGKITIDWNDGTDVVCEECGNKFFTEVYLFKRFSKLLTGAPSDTVQPLHTFACKECGHINSDFLPKEDKKSDIIG